MPDKDVVFMQQMEAYLESTAQEISRYVVFNDAFNVFTDNPADLRLKLRDIAKAGSRLHNIALEYRKLLFQIKRYHSIAQETLESARAAALAQLSEAERKGLSKEERQYLADSKLTNGELANFKFWTGGVLLCEDYVRMIEQRIKELSSAQKNVLGQITAVGQERRLHGTADGGWAHHV